MATEQSQVKILRLIEVEIEKGRSISIVSNNKYSTKMAQASSWI